MPIEFTPHSPVGNIHRCCKPLLLASVIGCSLLGGNWAQAEAQVQEPAVVASQNQTYGIPAQALDAALVAWSQASGVQLFADANLTRGLRSAAVQGSYSAAEALQLLLAGTGLVGHFTSADRVMLDKAPKQGSAVELGAISIAGTGLQSGIATEGTGSYTTGAMQTATKLPLSIRETPQAVTVMTRQQIEDQGLTTITDAVMKAPGLSMQKIGAERYNFYARGFAVDSIMYDGLPSRLDEAADTLSPANLAMYDRVEIVRGATGLVSGTGNPSAAINLVRKRPTSVPQASVTLSAGSWDNYRGELDVSGPLNDSRTLRGRTVLTYQDSDSFQDNVGKEHSLIYAIGEADLSDSTTLSVGFSRQDENNNVAWGGGLPTAADGSDFRLSRSTSFLADWEYWDKETDMLFVELKHEFGNEWILRAAANRSWSKLDYLGGYPGRTSSDLTNLRYRVSGGKFDDTQSSYDLYLSGPFQLWGRTHELVVGYSYREDDYDNNGSGITDVATVTDPSSFDPGSWSKPNVNLNSFTDSRDMTQEGVYASSRFSLADRLKLIVGARLDWYDYEYDYVWEGFADPTTKAKETRHLTRYAGLLYDLDQWHTLYVSYTDVFQPQSNRDISNQFLDPVEGNNYEIGIKGEYFGGALNASIAVFQIDQENRSKEVNDPTMCASWPSTSCYEAAGKVRSQGIEIELNGAITPNWQLAAGYTFAEAEYKKDSNPDNEGRLFDTDIPRHMFKLNTMYNLPGELYRWRVGGNFYHQSSVFNKGTTAGQGWFIEQDGYSLVGLNAGYKATEQLDIRFALNNLFDKKYYQTIGQNVSSWPTTFYGEPRNFQVSATYKF